MMMSIILILIPVAIIALIFLIVAAAKAGSDKGEGGGEEMIKNVYVYLILFTTLMMVIGGSVAAFMAAADIVSPTAYYQTFEDYKLRYQYDKPDTQAQEIEKAPISEEEMLANYNAMVQSEKDRQVQRAKNNLIKSFGWIVIPLPIFMFFQRHLLKKKETPSC